MDETGLIADMFCQIGQKGDDVMLGFTFDLVDPVDFKGAPFPDRFRSLLRNHAEFGLRVTGMGFDFEPDPELVLGFPDGSHFGA